jgi:two-component system CheB/CheR fusion protein
MDAQDQRLQFPIAAIGASAGGITALQSFFRALPSRPNIALVIIQHLSPGQPSHVVEPMGGWDRSPSAD